MAVCSEIHTKHINTAVWAERGIIYKYPVRTAQQTHCVSVIQTSQLLLYREIMAVCSEIHTKHINTAVWAERGIIYKYPVRTAQHTHCVSVIQTSQLLLYREIMAVCSEIHTKHINTVCGQNVELLMLNWWYI